MPVYNAPPPIYVGGSGSRDALALVDLVNRRRQQEETNRLRLRDDARADAAARRAEEIHPLAVKSYEDQAAKSEEERGRAKRQDESELALRDRVAGEIANIARDVQAGAVGRIEQLRAKMAAGQPLTDDETMNLAMAQQTASEVPPARMGVDPQTGEPVQVDMMADAINAAAEAFVRGDELNAMRALPPSVRQAYQEMQIASNPKEALVYERAEIELENSIRVGEKLGLEIAQLEAGFKAVGAGLPGSMEDQLTLMTKTRDGVGKASDMYYKSEEKLVQYRESILSTPLVSAIADRWLKESKTNSLDEAFWRSDAVMSANPVLARLTRNVDANITILQDAKAAYDAAMQRGLGGLPTSEFPLAEDPAGGPGGVDPAEVAEEQARHDRNQQESYAELALPDALVAAEQMLLRTDVDPGEKKRAARNALIAHGVPTDTVEARKWIKDRPEMFPEGPDYYDGSELMALVSALNQDRDVFYTYDFYPEVPPPDELPGGTQFSRTPRDRRERQRQVNRGAIEAPGNALRVLTGPDAPRVLGGTNIDEIDMWTGRQMIRAEGAVMNAYDKARAALFGQGGSANRYQGLRNAGR